MTFDLGGAPVVDFASQAVRVRLFQEQSLPPEDFEALAAGVTSFPAQRR